MAKSCEKLSAITSGGKILAAFFITACMIIPEARAQSEQALRRALNFKGAALAVEVESGRVILFKSNLSENINTVTIGSTVKPFVLLAALRAGQVKPEARVLCPASVPETPTEERCWFYGGHGQLNLREAIAVSCNVYFRSLAEQVRLVDFIGVLQKFKLCADCREIAERDPRERVELMIGMGDGIKTELDRLLAAYVAWFNGGRLFRFNLKAGALPTSWSAVDVSQEYLNIISGGMRACAEKGTCVQAQKMLGNLPILGKTGTSYYSLHGGDYRKTHGLFIALAPYPKPKLALLVFVEEGTGANDAVPIGGKLLKVLIEGRTVETVE
jgi:penicillin-binding protein 2